jgi:hypothetical protein
MRVPYGSLGGGVFLNCNAALDELLLLEKSIADRMADAKRAVAEPEKEKGKHHRHSTEKLKLRREYQDVMDQKKLTSTRV